MATLTAALQRTARLYGSNPATLEADGARTWAEVIVRIARAATLLGELGVGRGQRFALIAANSVRHAEMVYAGYWAGSIPVPINYRLAPTEIQTILRQADCRALVHDAEFSSLLQSAPLASWPGVRFMLNGDASTYESRLDEVAPWMPYDSEEGDEALLLYTGGTSGQPKGVPLTHRNIMANAMQIATAWPIGGPTVALHVAPMFHSAELCMTRFMLNGATHVYLDKFSPEALFRAIQNYRVTDVLLVPTMVMLAVQSGLAKRYDLSSLKRLLYGASPMSPAWLRKALSCFSGVEFVQGYGLTETAPLLCLLDFASHLQALNERDERRLGSCGQPLPGVDLRIANDRGQPLPPGETGEILVRGPNVFGGYWQQADLTAEALRDGWFHTGDAGTVDDRGYVYILDRKKDMIISGGENIYSGEVEVVLSEHPGIAEAAVIGVPDERYGESVCAVIVAAPGHQPTVREVIDHCRERIARYKTPRTVHFLERLPRSALGKVLKSDLRARFGGTDDLAAS